MSKEIKKIVKLCGTVNSERAVIILVKKCFHLIMLIPYLTDELLNNILHCNDTHKSAEFVYDECHMTFFLLEVSQQVIDLVVLGNVERLLVKGGHIRNAGVICMKKILFVDNALNIVYGISNNGKS